MKKFLTYSLFSGIIVVIVVCYFLIEPYVIYKIGRKTLPSFNEMLPAIEYNDLYSKSANQTLMNAYYDLQTPALSAAVGMQNTVVWTNAIGYSDIDQGKKASTSTMFRIGSVSKSLTSVAIGLLLQTKNLRLESKVSEFVPYAGQVLSDLNLRQLVSHTSGIRSFGIKLQFPIIDYYDNNEYKIIEESISIFKKDPLLFSPGSGYHYSSYNYNLISAMIEGASGKDYLTFMHDNVFIPLQLNHTEPEKNIDRENTAKFYEIDNGKYKKPYMINFSNRWAGGGFLSTPEDLVALGNAMLSNRILDSSTTKLLFTPIKLTNGEVNKENYAIGWRIETSEDVFNDKRKVEILYHGGSSLGSTALLVLFPVGEREGDECVLPQ